MQKKITGVLMLLVMGTGFSDVFAYRFVGGVYAQHVDANKADFVPPDLGANVGGVGPFVYNGSAFCDAQSADGPWGAFSKWIDTPPRPLAPEGVTMDFDLGEMVPITSISSIHVLEHHVLEHRDDWDGVESLRIFGSYDGMTNWFTIANVEKRVGREEKTVTLVTDKFRPEGWNPSRDPQVDTINLRYLRLQWPRNTDVGGNLPINEVIIEAAPEPGLLSLLLGSGLAGVFMYKLKYLKKFIRSDATVSGGARANTQLIDVA